MGDHSLDTAPPADIRQKSTLEKSKVARSLHLSVASPNETSTPTDRREASACTSLSGELALAQDRQHFPAHVARGADDGNAMAHRIGSPRQDRFGERTLIDHDRSGEAWILLNF